MSFYLPKLQQDGIILSITTVYAGMVKTVARIK